jgi:transposase
MTTNPSDNSAPGTPATPIERHAQFIALRAQGLSFARISEEIGVSKPTLIDWSRKYQYEIENLRAVELEALRHRYLVSAEARYQAVGGQLRRVEEELAKRDLADVSTGRLLMLAARLRSEVQRESGSMKFSVPSRRIPSDEYSEEVQDWNP